ncbi:MAG: hypothetical protein RIC19_09875 [Phaeodactylibacter sp.]|uniref:hypothetical protein n=1 Tax=Phaeodactylibacter sp. TaxID=1940289 RepID=UPI0032EE30B9
MKELDVEFDNNIKSLLYAIVYSYQESRSEEEVLSILEKIKRSKNILTPGQWLEFSMYFLAMGFFQSSLMCRNFSYKQFDAKSKLNRVVYPFNYNTLNLAKLFDSGNLNEFQKEIQRLKGNNNKYWEAIFLNNYEKAKNDAPQLFEFINSKSIAIVGPLKFDDNYKKEIESHDIIVELNALNSKREAVKNKYHAQPSIVTYNNYRIDCLKKQGFNDIIPNVKFHIVKRTKYLENLSKHGSVHVIPSTVTLNWNGSFSMMENTVADLLLFNPKSIKIYGVDLFTSYDYDPSYGNPFPKQLATITLNFSVHDIFMNYMFMHNLFTKRLVSGDRRLENVLKMGISNYTSKLKSVYPKMIGGQPIDVQNP